MVVEEDTPAFLVGRGGHTLILEGWEFSNAPMRWAVRLNPKTGTYFGANTKAYAEWAAAQGKPVLTDDQVALINNMAEACRTTLWRGILKRRCGRRRRAHRVL